MGSPPDELCRGEHESKETQHQVTLTHGFEISAHETTRTQFQALMGYLPPPNRKPPRTPCTLPACPVGMVSWHESISYCNALSTKKGLDACYTCTNYYRCSVAPKYHGKKIYSCPGYRLPTEAEWEYAYRAGTKTALYSGALTHCYDLTPNADKIAWYEKNSGMTTHPVGTKQPNGWGLYDMAGNAFEICHDWFQKDLGSMPVVDPSGPSGPNPSAALVIIKGGSSVNLGVFLRAADRENYFYEEKRNAFGFRCARTLKP